MPSRTFKDENGVTAIICSRGSRPKPCHYCGRPSIALCDFPVRPRGKKAGTCSVPLCAACTQKGVSPDTDFCRPHYPLARAAYERRQAKEREE